LRLEIERIRDIANGGFEPRLQSFARLEIVAEEAEIVRRIFGAFAVGQSPKAISAPASGATSRAASASSHVLNAGVLVWNRQRFVKDPPTGEDGWGHSSSLLDRMSQMMEGRIDGRRRRYAGRG
jgi:hypothetical protein